MFPAIPAPTTITPNTSKQINFELIMKDWFPFEALFTNSKIVSFVVEFIEMYIRLYTGELAQMVDRRSKFLASLSCFEI